MQKIAVFYLARIKEGLTHFEMFAQSYQNYPAGEPHDLYIIIKGDVKPGVMSGIEHIFSPIECKFIYVSDDGYDIHAYIKAAKQIPHDDVCFFNTFTQLQSENWLSKMVTNYRKPGVGAVGTTGSYESLYSSYKLINKTIWLSTQRVRYNKKFVKYFKFVLKIHNASWLNYTSLYKKTKRFLGDILYKRVSVYDSTLHIEFEPHWKKLIEEGESFHFVNRFPVFPNPHLRSNGFLVAKSMLLEFDDLGNGKYDCCHFESGLNGLSARIIKLGLDLLVVGADGVGYSILDWPKSNTFRLSNQENLLISDNQTRKFFIENAYDRAVSKRMTWGDYLNHLPIYQNKRVSEFIDLGLDFKINNHRLNIKKQVIKRKISIVIPTHNRLALLKDAMQTVLKQKKYDNWELIIFDNASSDPIHEFIETLDEPRIHYKKSNEFLPVTESWNSAIDMATGDYVMLIGDDDGLIPDYFNKINLLISNFNEPDFIYSAVYQFMHPGVSPFLREGYLELLKIGFFFAQRENPFRLNEKDAALAWQGSLDIKRNFGLSTQPFTFKRTFLESLRINGKIFHSTYPDYYLANLAMAKGKNIIVSPDPYAIAGVSTASFGYTLINSLQEAGKDILNAPLLNDPLYPKYEQHLLPGSHYQDNFIVTMGHVAKNMPTNYSLQTGIKRYRRLQLFSHIKMQNELWWMKSENGKFLWSKLKVTEKIWALWATFYCRAGKNNKIRSMISETASIPVQIRIATGEFARLPQVYEMLENQSD